MLVVLYRIGIEYSMLKLSGRFDYIPGFTSSSINTSQDNQLLWYRCLCASEVGEI